MNETQNKKNELSDIPNMSLDRLKLYQSVLRTLCAIFTVIGSGAISIMFYIVTYTIESHPIYMAILVFLTIISLAFFIPVYFILSDIKIWISFRKMFSNTLRDIKQGRDKNA